MKQPTQSTNGLVDFFLSYQKDVLLANLPNDADGRRAASNAITRRLEQTYLMLTAIAHPDVVAEVGAHGAEYSRSCRDILPNARIVAVEANPNVHKRFKEILEKARIESHNLAFSSHSGQVSFAVPKMPRGEFVEFMGSMLQHTHSKEMQSMDINAVRGDEFFEADLEQRFAFWIDVEGAALDVISGLEGILPSVDLMFVEVEEARVWQDQALAPEVLEYLSGYGLVPVLRDVYRENRQFNCLLVRDGLLKNPAVRLTLNKHLSSIICYR